MSEAPHGHRLRLYRVSLPGQVYSVTICCADREAFFEGKDVRDLVSALIEGSVAHGFSRLEAYVVMPDHVHGIIVLTDDVSVPVGQAPAPALRWIVGTPAFNVSGYHRGLPLPNPRAPPGPNGCHCPTSSNGSNH